MYFMVYSRIETILVLNTKIVLQADQNRIARNQPPLYGLVGRFERINEHPVEYAFHILLVWKVLRLLSLTGKMHARVQGLVHFPLG